jgi:hypothetical protein
MCIPLRSQRTHARQQTIMTPTAALSVVVRIQHVIAQLMRLKHTEYALKTTRFGRVKKTLHKVTHHQYYIREALITSAQLCSKLECLLKDLHTHHINTKRTYTTLSLLDTINCVLSCTRAPKQHSVNVQSLTLYALSPRLEARSMHYHAAEVVDRAVQHKLRGVTVVTVQ